MALLRLRITLCQFFLQTISALSYQQLRIHTEPQYLSVRWHVSHIPPSKWKIAYSVTGTGYHSFKTVAGTESSANITTIEYPGTFYSIQLFASDNGSTSLAGQGFARADCSHSVEVHLDDSYQIESPGYPNSPVRGQMCRWTISGSSHTWYKISFIDLDFGNEKSCANHLQIEDKILCDNGSFNDTLVVHSSSMNWTFVYVQDFGGKGFSANVTAIWKVQKPENLTAVLTNDVVTVSWLEPFDSPPGVFYFLRVSHYPHTEHTDLIIPENITSHDFNVTNHAGQNFTVQVKAATQNSVGDFSAPVTIQTSCDRTIYIRQLQTLVLTSQHFPFHYLAGVYCHDSIRTSDESFLKLTIEALDIDGGSDCVSGYLELDHLGRFCNDSPPQVLYVVPVSTLSVNFLAGNAVKGKGFNMTIKPVAKPPSAPFNLETRTEPGKIYLHWTPPSLRGDHVTGYIVQYTILPDSASETLPIARNSTNVVLPTINNSGRLFVFRVRATSEGGDSHFSIPHYARTSCGSSFDLSRLNSAFILSPKDQHGRYQKGVVCHWTIATSSPLWLHVEVAKFDLEFSEKCSKDSVNFSSSVIGKLCGNNLTGVSFVVKQAQINIVFMTDYNNENQGFIFKITGAGPAPSKPNSLKLIPSSYSLIVSWTPPIIYRRYLTGYLMHYRIYGNNTIHTDQILPQQTVHAIDTTNTPGSLFEVWVQAQGDVEGSDTTDKLVAYAACGQNFSMDDEVVYITSPHYPHLYRSNVRCQWQILVMVNTSVTITFLKIDLKNTNNCTDNITVSDFGVICDDAVENNDIVLDNVKNISISFQTDDIQAGSGFVMLVEGTRRLTSPTKASRSRSMSRAAHLEPSPILLSATSFVITSAVTSSIVSSDTITPSPDSFIQSIINLSPSKSSMFTLTHSGILLNPTSNLIRIPERMSRSLPDVFVDDLNLRTKLMEMALLSGSVSIENTSVVVALNTNESLFENTIISASISQIRNTLDVFNATDNDRKSEDVFTIESESLQYKPDLSFYLNTTLVKDVLPTLRSVEGAGRSMNVTSLTKCDLGDITECELITPSKSRPLFSRTKQTDSVDLSNESLMLITNNTQIVDDLQRLFPSLNINGSNSYPYAIKTSSILRSQNATRLQFSFHKTSAIEQGLNPSPALNFKAHHSFINSDKYSASLTYSLPALSYHKYSTLTYDISISPTSVLASSNVKASSTSREYSVLLLFLSMLVTMLH